MENPTSLRNLSLALRHILQQFMDSNKSGEHKNADMTLPHNGYFQRLSWYFECDHCHYRTFYVREIEAHRQICSIANGVSTSHVTIPKCENTSAVAATTPVLNGGTGEQDAMSIQSPVMLDGLALSSIDNPLAQTTDASASLVNDTDTAFAISPDVKQELRRYLGASGVETPLQNNSAVINKPKRRRSRKSQVNKRGSVSSQFLNAVSTPKPSTSGCQPSAAATQNTWEEIEQIFVSAEGEGQESLNRSGRSRKRKVRTDEGGCWLEGETSAETAAYHVMSDVGDEKWLSEDTEVKDDYRQSLVKDLSQHPGVTATCRTSKVDHKQCIYRCDLLVNEEAKKTIYENFSALNVDGRIEYYNLTISAKMANARSRPGYKGKKQNIREYNVILNGERKRVCKDFYCHLHRVSASRINAGLQQQQTAASVTFSGEMTPS